MFQDEKNQIMTTNVWLVQVSNLSISLSLSLSLSRFIQLFSYSFFVVRRFSVVFVGRHVCLITIRLR